MSEKEKNDPLLEDLDKQKGYKRDYSGALRNLINSLNWLLENEPNKSLRNDYKHLVDHANKRYRTLCEIFH